MRKWISCFLALVLLISLSLPALAAESEAQAAAQTLYEMGLFKGTGRMLPESPRLIWNVRRRGRRL